jgi:hypothetical protein
MAETVEIPLKPRSLQEQIWNLVTKNQLIEWRLDKLEKRIKKLEDDRK